MITVYQDPPKLDELRLEAAKAAAHYQKISLSASTVEVRDAMSTMTAAQLIASAAPSSRRLSERSAADGVTAEMASMTACELAAGHNAHMPATSASAGRSTVLATRSSNVL